jgi:hypothetical protein
MLIAVDVCFVDAVDVLVAVVDVVAVVAVVAVAVVVVDIGRIACEFNFSAMLAVLLVIAISAQIKGDTISSDSPRNDGLLVSWTSRKDKYLSPDQARLICEGDR